MTKHVKQVFETILVAYDGSPQSQRATDIAFSMAQALGSKLLIFAVIRPPEPAARAELNAILDDAREHYEQSFVLLRERAAKGGLRLKRRSRSTIRPSTSSTVRNKHTPH